MRQPLKMHIELTIEGAAECDEETSALMEYFGVIRVDRRKVPNGERQQPLNGRNERKRAMRSLRLRLLTERNAP